MSNESSKSWDYTNKTHRIFFDIRENNDLKTVYKCPLFYSAQKNVNDDLKIVYKCPLFYYALNFGNADLQIVYESPLFYNAEKS